VDVEIDAVVRPRLRWRTTRVPVLSSHMELSSSASSPNGCGSVSLPALSAIVPRQARSVRPPSDAQPERRFVSQQRRSANANWATTSSTTKHVS